MQSVLGLITNIYLYIYIYQNEPLRNLFKYIVFPTRVKFDFDYNEKVLSQSAQPQSEAKL